MVSPSLAKVTVLRLGPVLASMARKVGHLATIGALRPPQAATTLQTKRSTLKTATNRSIVANRACSNSDRWSLPITAERCRRKLEATGRGHGTSEVWGLRPLLREETSKSGNETVCPVFFTPYCGGLTASDAVGGRSAIVAIVGLSYSLLISTSL